jgi:head-tail adaptor
MLTSKLTLSIVAAQIAALDLESPEADLTKSYVDSFANGTGANQAQEMFSDSRTITGSGTDNLDLSGHLARSARRHRRFHGREGNRVSEHRHGPDPRRQEGHQRLCRSVRSDGGLARTHRRAGRTYFVSNPAPLDGPCGGDRRPAERRKPQRERCGVRRHPHRQVKRRRSNRAMKAGKLDRRVTIEGMGPATDDGLRVKPGGWFKLYDRWAELTPLTGAERVAAAENAAFETLKFRIRRDQKTILIGAKTNRLIYRGEPFDIGGAGGSRAGSARFAGDWRAQMLPTKLRPMTLTVTMEGAAELEAALKEIAKRTTQKAVVQRTLGQGGRADTEPMGGAGAVRRRGSGLSPSRFDHCRSEDRVAPDAGECGAGRRHDLHRPGQEPGAAPRHFHGVRHVQGPGAALGSPGLGSDQGWRILDPRLPDVGRDRRDGAPCRGASGADWGERMFEEDLRARLG